MIYIAERMGVFFLEKPLYEVCIVRIKEQVDEKRSTVGIPRNTDCVLKTLNISNVINKKKLDHFDDVRIIC